MKAIVDEVLCAGHGVCEEVAPLLFLVGDDGIARVLLQDFGEEYLQEATLAKLRCPAEAITLIQ
jgi:ferredoxin